VNLLLPLRTLFVNQTLIKVKKIITDDPNSFVLLSDRDKNAETLLKLGFMPKNAIDELLSLTALDYVKGPEDNTSESGPRKGEIWKFGKVINGIEVYIKIHLVPTKKNTQCLCISFHESAYPLHYPLKK